MWWVGVIEVISNVDSSCCLNSARSLYQYREVFSNTVWFEYMAQTHVWILGLISHCYFRMLEEKEEPGFLTGLKIPAPWAAGKTVETVHPVRDNYKFKETVHIPGARCLYLRFDNRCSSQYDYDKVSPCQLKFFLCVLLSAALFSAFLPLSFLGVLLPVVRIVKEVFIGRRWTYAVMSQSACFYVLKYRDAEGLFLILHKCE